MDCLDESVTLQSTWSQTCLVCALDVHYISPFPVFFMCQTAKLKKKWSDIKFCLFDDLSVLGIAGFNYVT